MELSVPTNWDDDLLDSLQGFPVGDLYGQPDDSPTGGGRPRYLQDRVGKKRVAAHLRKIRDSGWGFTALLNAPCLDNREYQSSFRRSLMDWVGWMRGAGATGVTVTVPLAVVINVASSVSALVLMSTLPATLTAASNSTSASTAVVLPIVNALTSTVAAAPVK